MVTCALLMQARRSYAYTHVQPRMVGKSQIAIVAAPLRWHSKVMPISNMDSGKKRQNAQERPRGNFKTEVVLTWTEFAMQTDTEFFRTRLSSGDLRPCICNRDDITIHSEAHTSAKKNCIGSNVSLSSEKYQVGEIPKPKSSPYSRNNRESQPAAVSKELIATCAVLSGSAHARWEGADTE